MSDRFIDSLARHLAVAMPSRRGVLCLAAGGALAGLALVRQDATAGDPCGQCDPARCLECGKLGCVSTCGPCQRCVGGACLSGCRSGLACVDGACRCTRASCSGCCDGNACQLGIKNDACGRGGRRCGRCPRGTACTGRRCLALPVGGGTGGGGGSHRAHAGDPCDGERACAHRLRCVRGRCRIRTGDHCDLKNPHAWCISGFCASGQHSPHGTPVCAKR